MHVTESKLHSVVNDNYASSQWHKCFETFYHLHPLRSSQWQICIWWMPNMGLINDKNAETQAESRLLRESVNDKYADCSVKITLVGHCIFVIDYNQWHKMQVTEFKSHSVVNDIYAFGQWQICRHPGFFASPYRAVNDKYAFSQWQICKWRV